MTNGLSHGESIFIFRGIRSNFSFLFHFSMKIFSANRLAPDGTPHVAATHLGLFCLSMSHKKDARLKWVRFLIPKFPDGLNLTLSRIPKTDFLMNSLKIVFAVHETAGLLNSSPFC